MTWRETATDKFRFNGRRSKQSRCFALTSIDLFAAAFHFHGGCRRISAFGQRDFHHAQVCLRATFGFTPNGARSLPTKAFDLNRLLGNENYFKFSNRGRAIAIFVLLPEGGERLN